MPERMDSGDDVTRIARGIIARADAHRWQGEKGEDFALEAACAAHTTAMALFGRTHPVAQRVRGLALLVQVEQLAGLRRRAAEPLAEEQGQEEER